MNVKQKTALLLKCIPVHDVIVNRPCHNNNVQTRYHGMYLAGTTKNKQEQQEQVNNRESHGTFRWPGVLLLLQLCVGSPLKTQHTNTIHHVN